MTKLKKWFSLSDLFLIPVCLVFVYPFYYLVISTIKTQQEVAYEPAGLPKSLYLDNYISIFESGVLGRAFFNTITITLFAVVLIVFIGEMAAYPIVFRKNKFNNFAMTYLLLGFLVPFQAVLLQLFQVMQSLGLLDKIYGIILFYSNSCALTVFLTVGYMRTIPRELLEAAIIDGCSIPKAFFRIIFPLLKPIMITTIIFNTSWIWNDFIAPNIFLNSRSNATLVLEIYQAKGQFSVDWPKFMSLSVITIFPIFVFFVCMQKYIINGLTAGAVKG